MGRRLNQLSYQRPLRLNLIISRCHEKVENDFALVTVLSTSEVVSLTETGKKYSFVEQMTIIGELHIKIIVDCLLQPGKKRMLSFPPRPFQT